MVSPQAYGNLYGGFNSRHYTLVHACMVSGPKQLTLYQPMTANAVMTFVNSP